MPKKNQQNMHATCVSINGKGVLLMGKSASGKSDFALRLIDEGATLVADDQTLVTTPENKKEVFASPPLNLAGKLEVRGLGIFKMPFEQCIPIKMVVNLDANTNQERLPQKQSMTQIKGIDITTIHINPFEVSATTKIRLILNKKPLDL